ncbi:GntR family transcriptional regulator [Couchioplanes caeruleus]|uniref:GntR family transcriptional regulator n=1 Tax=Couchioplanes caeruleus TaxID=56438 RepID=UPI00201CAA98|nr:GntR family transcriptional regulator [Couchioplanes caeruleus]UQU65816.1 GntR family transcriptional regulator [Couchioplanes caeruleus]
MSDLPTLTVSASDPTPPYEQVRRQVAALIESGALTEGTRLPPVRQLAGDLSLAVGTVARAYRELETAGLLVTRRGGGTRVADFLPRAADDTALRRAAEEYVTRARLADAGDDAIVAAVHAALGQPYGASS